MSISRGAILGLLMVCAMALVKLAMNSSGTSASRHDVTVSREEKLQAACKANPADCIVMRRSRQAAEEEMQRALRLPSPQVKAAVNDLQQTLRRYEDRFIATGQYEDPSV